MNVSVFSAKPFEKTSLDVANAGRHHISYYPEPLSVSTAHGMKGFALLSALPIDVLFIQRKKEPSLDVRYFVESKNLSISYLKC